MSSGYGSTWDAKQERIRERRDAAKRLLEGGRAYRDGQHSEQGDLQAVADSYLVLTADPSAEPSVADIDKVFTETTLTQQECDDLEKQRQHADPPAEPAAEGVRQHLYNTMPGCREDGSAESVAYCRGYRAAQYEAAKVILADLTALQAEIAKLRAELDKARAWWFGQKIIREMTQDVRCRHCGNLYSASTESEMCKRHEWVSGATLAAEAEIAKLRAERDALLKLDRRRVEEIESLHDMADAVERLREIGRATGCDHVDDPDGRAQLVNCVEQVIAAAEQERDQLKAENERLRGENAELFLGLDTVRRQKESAEQQLGQHIRRLNQAEEAASELSRQELEAAYANEQSCVVFWQNKAEAAERAAAELRQRVAELAHWSRELLLAIDQQFGSQPRFDGGLIAKVNTALAHVAELESKGAK